MDGCWASDVKPEQVKAAKSTVLDSMFCIDFGFAVMAKVLHKAKSPIKSCVSGISKG